MSWAHFDAHIHNLSRAIAKVFKPQVVVGIVHGGVFVGGALARALSSEFLPVRVGARSRDTKKASRRVSSLGKEAEVLRGRRTLVVDDVASSGEALELTKVLAEKAGARKVHTASLICRPSSYQPDFSAETTGELVVFPWDYQAVVEDYRFERPS
jgi:hypoxanthine phosphoribosyltransferase